MSAKEEVSKETPERADVEALLAHWDFPFPLGEFKVLFGGYSGTSIKVVGGNGVRHVLKICHGYERADVEAQARVAVYARGCGCDEICTFYPVKGDPSAFAIERKKDRTPVCLLSWVDGMAADKVLSAGKVPASIVLHAVGAGLGRLHSVPPPAGAGAASIRVVESNGACDVRRHLSDELAKAFETSAVVRGHPFLPFYTAQLENLKAAWTSPGLPRGVLHGDPFLDNIMLDPESGGLEGFVDMEDVCIGPLLFDIACCASACCFRADDNALDMRRMRHLLGGYASERPLGLSERKVFVAFMKLTMLCNCTWRFKNFNIDHRELESCRDAHVELQERIEALEDDMTAGFIEAILTELPKEKKPLAVAKPPPQGGAPKAPADATPAPAGKLSPFSVALGVAVVAAACVFFARRSR
jgi:Ser/Thr protein kinase RdoA (MazF antagonist)